MSTTATRTWEHPRAQVYATQDAWLRAREGKITASKGPSVVHAHPWRSAYALACEMRKLVEPEPPRNPEILEWGLRLEPVLRRAVKDHAGVEVFNPGYCLITHPTISFLASSMDGVLVHGDLPGYGCLEIKTTNTYSEDAWAEGPPRYPWTQLQHQMMCTGYKWGIIAVLIGGQKFKWFMVEADPVWVGSEYEPKLIEFYEKVTRGEELEVDGSDSTNSVLRRRWPRDEEEVIALNADMLDWHDQRVKACEYIKECEALKQEANNHLIAAIGTAARAVLPGGVEYLYRADKRGRRSLRPRKKKEE